VYYPFNIIVHNTTNNFATLSYDTSFIGIPSISYNNSLVGTGALSLENIAYGTSSNYVLSRPTINSVPINFNANLGLTISCWVNANGISNRNMTIFDICTKPGIQGINIDISGTNSLYSSYNPIYNYYVLQNSIYGTINCISINDFGYLVMATSTGIFYSSNLGVSWNISDAPINNNWVSISLVNSGSGYALACTNSVIYYSVNGGINWIITGAPTSGYTYVAVSLSSSGNAIVIAGSTAIYSSGNFVTWYSSNIGFSAFTIGLANNGVGIVTGNNAVAITKDNGQSWTPNSVQFALGGNISDNGNYLVVNSFNGSQVAPLYYSLDQGNTWNASLNGKISLAGNLVVGNNGKVFNRDNSIIYETNLLTDSIMYSTGYIGTNLSISTNGIFAAFTVANDLNFSKIIIKNT
jgi:hypothetical protein